MSSLACPPLSNKTVDFQELIQAKRRPGRYVFCGHRAIISPKMCVALSPC